MTTALTEILVGQDAQKNIKARALFEKVKEIPYVFNASPSWKSLSDRSIIGATVMAPSLMRTRITIHKLKEAGWDVEDRWPTSTNLFIRFKLD